MTKWDWKLSEIIFTFLNSKIRSYSNLYSALKSFHDNVLQYEVYLYKYLFFFSAPMEGVFPFLNRGSKKRECLVLYRL